MLRRMEGVRTEPVFLFTNVPKQMGLSGHLPKREFPLDASKKKKHTCSGAKKTKQQNSESTKHTFPQAHIGLSQN